MIFGQTFAEAGQIERALIEEETGRRDIARYLPDPQVLVGLAPSSLFIDPSLTYRLELHRYRPATHPVRGVIVRKMDTRDDAQQINRIYSANGMLTLIWT